MPNIKSAIKRVNSNARKAGFNKAKKSELRTAVKTAVNALNDSAESSVAVLKATQAKLDRAVSQGLIHKNKAARQKSRLSKKLNTLAK